MPSFRDVVGSKFQAAKDFDKRNFKGKIIEVKREKQDHDDDDSDSRLIMKLNNHSKWFQLNVGNCESFAEKWGDDYEKWVGKTVIINTVARTMQGKPCRGFEMKPDSK